MTQEVLTHLTEEALDDALIGMESAESRAHLARCLECRGKIERFGADMALFNAASMAWSEAQPRRPLEPARLTPARRMPFALVGSTVAAALAVAVVLSVGHHDVGFAPQSRSGNAAQIQDSQTQIAQDNQLMEDVNAAIGPQEVSPMDEFGLSKRHGTHSRAYPK
jgi:anti-sigma factor RsiW